jgi:hypothetical protein
MDAVLQHRNQVVPLLCVQEPEILPIIFVGQPR